MGAGRSWELAVVGCRGSWELGVVGSSGVVGSWEKLGDERSWELREVGSREWLEAGPTNGSKGDTEEQGRGFGAGMMDGSRDYR